MTSSDDLREALQTVPPPTFSHYATPQEDSLARAYAIHHDPAKAYEDAGYPPLVSKKAESTMAYKLLQMLRVSERLDYYHQLQAVRLDIRDDRLMAELAAVAFSDPIDFFGEDGKMLDLKLIPKHARAAISTIEINEVEDLLENGDTRIKRRTKIQLWNKMKALDLAARVKGLYHDASRADAPRVIFEVPATEQVKPKHQEYDFL